jgi:tetratricopeptide (TPR) repeat protein
MTEAVISEFARLGALNVISRTSVMRYKESDKSLPEIARELNVQGIVEGSVFRAGDRVRITLQLIDARNDLHLWAQTYERDLSDVLALQSDVARAVTEQIQLELTPEEQGVLSTSRTVDPQAYDAYLRGLQLRGHGLVADWAPKAIEQFGRAVELDPNFAEAYTALADAHDWLATAGWNVQYHAEFAKAREAAERALALDGHLGSAHAVLGAVRLNHAWDFPGARRAYERAVQLSPSDPTTLNNYIWYLLIVGRSEEALRVMERLLHVAPFDFFYQRLRPRNFMYAREFERALDEFDRLREMDPDFVGIAYLDAAWVLGKLGRTEESFHTYIAFYDGCGAPCDWMREASERGWAEDGMDGSMRSWLRVATSIDGFSSWNIAQVYATLGEADEALGWLERAYEERDPLMIILKAHPAFDPLRSDPRFQDLLRRIGFPEE